MKDVRVPEQLMRAMAAEAEAAREARAKVIAAEGEHRASRALRHAAEVIVDSPAALQVRIISRHSNIYILILRPRLEQLFSCGDKACVAQLIMDGGAELRSWNMAINAVVSQLAPMRCDCCFLLAPVKEVHRFQQKFRKHIVN